jgi:Family of unknown function (DUF6173)
VKHDPALIEESQMAKAVTKKPAAKKVPERPKSPAEWAHDRLVLYIRNFESQLDAKHEIAMGLAGDEAGVLRIEGIGFFDPDMITFYGRDESGAKTQLIQHFSKLSVTLRAVPKQTDAEPARRIGFQLTAGWVGGDSGDGSAG